MEDAGIGINELILQLSVASVAIWALITSIRGRNANDARLAENEKGQQALEAQQLKYDDAEKTRRAEMDERWANMYQQLVANNSSLTEAVKGMAVLEQQNQRLLERIVESQDVSLVIQQGNKTSLQTLTGSMDSAVATLGRIEKALADGNTDHEKIAVALGDLKKAMKRIEAKLPTPTPPPSEPALQTVITVAEHKPDAGEQQDAAA